MTGLGQYGPFVYQKKPKEDTEKLNFQIHTYSEGEDSEIELDGKLISEKKSIEKLRCTLEDDLDKMGPRKYHCVNYMIKHEYL